MFRPLTTFLTLSVLVLHSLLGCCWHHAHVCGHGHTVEGCQASQKHNSAEHVDGCGTLGHADHDHGLMATLHDGDADASHKSHGCPHEPCRHDCEGEDCNFTQASRVKAPEPAENGVQWSQSLILPSLPSATAMLSRLETGTSSHQASLVCCSRPMTQVWRL